MTVITIEQNENETPLQSSTVSKKKANKGRNKAPQSVTICGQNGVALELKFQNKDESSTKVNVLIEDYDFRRLQISGMNRSHSSWKNALVSSSIYCCLKKPTLASS